MNDTCNFFIIVLSHTGASPCLRLDIFNPRLQKGLDFSRSYLPCSKLTFFCSWWMAVLLKLTAAQSPVESMLKQGLLGSTLSFSFGKSDVGPEFLGDAVAIWRTTGLQNAISCPFGEHHTISVLFFLHWSSQTLFPSPILFLLKQSGGITYPLTEDFHFSRT